MTHARYEIEFQGSRDGKTWTAYPFRYKPQDLRQPPGIYAPYQPRFDWNLWFASLGRWQDYRFVVWTEERLLRNSPDVLELFAGNPFDNAPPQQVRTIIYQYWFTDSKTKHGTGNWWRREALGEYAPALARQPDGKIALLDIPIAQPPAPRALFLSSSRFFQCDCDFHTDHDIDLAATVPHNAPRYTQAPAKQRFGSRVIWTHVTALAPENVLGENKAK